MKLKAFKERNNKRIGIIVFTITCILLITGVILYRTFAIFESNGEFNVINGKVQDMGDIQFVFYVDDKISNKAPEEKGKYSLDTSKSHCNNGAMIYWNEITNRAEIGNLTETKTKCYLYFKEIYKEEILKGAIPDLGNGRLIPVTISDSEKPTGVNYNGESAGGKVLKADITNKENPWYKYEDHKWANAVILKDGEIDNYEPNQEIPEDKIESYFVWIPRYSYKLQDSEDIFNGYTSATKIQDPIDDNSDIPNLGANNPYEITFENKDTPREEGTTKGSSLSHPAFESFKSNGMWVGKFETGTTLTSDYNVRNSDVIQIKPNVYSWRNIDVSHAFYTSYDYQSNLQSHMIKKSEWGAVFYLTQSKYGRCTGNTCTEPRINNNSKSITGFSAKNEPTCGYTGTDEVCNKQETKADFNADGKDGWNYYNPSSQVASTTGNYSGIYDMSGGSWEYAMGVLEYKLNSGIPTSGRNSEVNSGFNGPYSVNSGEKIDGLDWPDPKYYDLYDYNTNNTTYQRGKLGDATKELGPFYSVCYDYNDKPLRYVGSYFANDSAIVYSNSPWFILGGHFTMGTDAGVGAFNVAPGSASNDFGFRIVLIP